MIVNFGKKYMVKNILVTGATGFIASHLVPVLAQNWHIRAALRQETKGDNFSKSITTITVGEIDGETNWHQSLEGIDTVIHLAGRAHILAEKVANPEQEFLRVNTFGTANLVKQSLAMGVKHFIFISSIGAMASLNEQILRENSPCQPDTPYGHSKLLAEKALIEETKNSNMTWTIIRPPLVYGPGNPGNMERLIKLINLGLPLPFAAINNRRSLVFVENLVDALVSVLRYPHKAANQIFLISDGQDVSTSELIDKISQLKNKPIKQLPVPPNLLTILGKGGDYVENMLHRQMPINSTTVERLVGSLFVDIRYIQNTLLWHPPYTIDQGLEKTLSS